MRVIRHMMMHSEEKPFLCPDCGLAFKQLAQLKNHEVVHKMPDDVSYNYSQVLSGYNLNLIKDAIVGQSKEMH